MSVFTGLPLDCVDGLPADLGWAWLVALVQSVCLPEPGSSPQGGLCSGSWAGGTDTPHGRLGLTCSVIYLSVSGVLPVFKPLCVNSSARHLPVWGNLLSVNYSIPFSG